MNRRISHLTVGAVLTLLQCGCATEAPFVVSDYRVHQRGQVTVCFDPDASTADQVKIKADEECRQYDRVARLELVQENQCSWTAPSQATFSCVARPGETPSPIQQRLAPMRHDTALPP